MLMNCNLYIHKQDLTRLNENKQYLTYMNESERYLLYTNESYNIVICTSSRNDQEMTKKWPWNDQEMTKKWPRNDHEMTMKWPWNDHEMTIKWPRNTVHFLSNVNLPHALLPLSLMGALTSSIKHFFRHEHFMSEQGILKGEVPMYHWPPVWLVLMRMFCK